MRKSLFVVVALLCLVATACTASPDTSSDYAQRPASAQGGQTFDSPIETPLPGATATSAVPLAPPVVIDLALSEPLQVSQPATLTIDIQANKALITPLLSFGIATESADNLQPYSMTLPSLAQDEHRQVSKALLIPSQEGRYRILVFLTDHETGANHHGALFFAVVNGSVVLNPTPGPAVAATVILVGGTQTPNPTRTPQSSVTTVPQSTPTPEAVAPSSILLSGHQAEVEDKSLNDGATPTPLAVTIKGRPETS